jgi:hypothetical protein
MKEVLKGVDLTAGTMTAGWGFHCWPESTPETTEWLTYSADDAALMVENGSIVTNSVFARNVPAMFDPQMSLDERHYILAFAIPALARPTGGRDLYNVLDWRDYFNMNLPAERQVSNDGQTITQGIQRPNGWPTRTRWDDRWLHSDMKDVSFFYNFKFYEKVVEKGELR